MNNRSNFFLFTAIIFLGLLVPAQRAKAQCATLSSYLELVSNNGNGTCTYRLHFSISGWSNGLKSYEIQELNQNTLISVCTPLPSGNSLTAVSPDFVYPCTTTGNFEFHFGTSQANCGGGGSCAQQFISSFALPVTWLDFRVMQGAAGQYNLLWTVEEKNVADYTIESSEDGAHFMPLGIVKSTQDGQATYSFQASLANVTKAYFRIKQKDMDGGINYSRIIKVGEESSSNDFTLYPNPVQQQLTLYGTSKGESIFITDAMGRSVMKVLATNSFMHIDLSTLLPGMYFVRNESGLVRKLMKL